MSTPDLAAVQQAAERIRPHVRRTPLIEVELHDLPVLLKLENLQVTGSFKARGATNAVLQLVEEGAIEVAAASGGNHGLGVAFAAARSGVRATVVVPDAVPHEKARRLADAGATVVRAGESYAEAQAHAQRMAAERGLPFVHPFADPQVVAGQGTVGLEVLEDDTPDVVLVAVGGGGLVCGVGLACEGRTTVVGVEPAGIPTLHAALVAGHPVDVPVASVAASALGATRTAELNVAIAERTVDRVVLVDDDALLAARDTLWETCRLAVEPAAAAGIAAIATGQVPATRPCVVVCGANSAWRPDG